jgi:hypothetical protein
MALINPVIERRAAQALRVLSRHMQVRAGYVFGSYVDGKRSQGKLMENQWVNF